jgi:hypothetical protein
MQNKLTCLSLAALVFASCDKSGTKAAPDESSSKKPQLENRTHAPTIAEKTAPAQHDAPDANIRKPIDPPISHPVDASMIRPAGTVPEDAWDTLTAEQMIGKFNSSGIARMPKDISDKILADASSAASPEDQVHYITRQAAAWHRINEFKEGVNGMPDHMRMALLERLSMKHGDSWLNMVPELDEQIAASAKVMELRLNGIPGMSPDESQDLLIKALEQYGPDYKTILSIANQSASK